MSKPTVKMLSIDREPDFSGLVLSIRDIHEQCAAQASRAVNLSLTFRNWLIGAHVHHYELKGADRASYGDKLPHKLAEQLTLDELSNCNHRQLYRCLHFYRLYPAIVRTLSPQFAALQPPATESIAAQVKVGTTSPLSKEK